MLEIKNLSVTYPNGVRALSNANLNLSEGGLYGILGANGSGKTTLLKGMLGLVPAVGEVLFNGRPVRQFVKETAYVEQKGKFDMDFPITVFQCVMTGTYPRLGLLKKPSKKEREDCRAAIAQVGLTDLENRQIGELSGGQFQRVLIARMLLQHARLILLDEPLAGIDVVSESIILKLLRDLSAQNKTILMVHHNLSQARDYFDEVILVNKTIIDYGSAEEVLVKDKLEKTFELYADPLFNIKN